MTTTEKRAADLRRAKAERAGEQRGQAAYDLALRTAPYAKQYRKPTMQLELRGAQEVSGGRKLLHTSGYFTRYEMAYPMWDEAGRYDEMTMKRSGALTLAAKPDLGFLINHKGVTMARTKTRSLILSEDNDGGYHEAFMNMERSDVSLLAHAIADGDIDEMSFAFLIPDGGGTWTKDFTTFQISQYDLSGGDVSAVNRGANPFTDISANADEILRDLAHLPEGAKDEARRSLGVDEIERRTDVRERIQVTPRAVDRSASPHVRRLQWTVANTARRMNELAASTGMTLAELTNARLPWYEIRSAAGADLLDPAEDGTVQETVGDTTEVLIYDEIGGSFGTSADQFASDLAAITTPKILLRINSPGGSVQDAIAIASTIRHHPAHIKASIDGWAASAATIIMLAADEIEGMPGMELMIHKASMQVNGNETELGQLRTFLQKQDQNIAEQYAGKAGGDPTEWLSMMADETWFLASEALEAGLIDSLWSSQSKTRKATDDRLTRAWVGTPYHYVNRADAPVTQQRRALLGKPDIAPSPVQQARPDDLSTAPERAGRSIALIQATMAADGEDLSW